MTTRQDEVWKSETLTRTFLDGVRGGLPFANEQIDIMLRLLAANDGPVERVADLGCGSGVLAQAVLAQYPQAQATLVDFSEPMLREARANLEAAAQRTNFILADLGSADWLHSLEAGASFDVIVSGLAIHHLPDERKRQLYGEIFGLLRPGGLFLHLEHVASATPWVEAVWDDLFIDSLFAYHTRSGSGKSRAQVMEEFTHRADKDANLLSPVERQCTWLSACGFADVDCYFKIFELAVFGGRRPAVN